jgi:hypothetical protein
MSLEPHATFTGVLQQADKVVAKVLKHAENQDRVIASLRREVAILSSMCATLDKDLHEVKRLHERTIGELQTTEDTLAMERMERIVRQAAADEKQRA